MSTLSASGYAFIESLGIWARPDYPGTTYSDGDETENRLLDVISQASDVSLFSKELHKHCVDWPSRYHLSAIRSNILRPFEAVLKGADVLEIGAGCGAVTRYLGESGASVLALEGSTRRASIAASRTRDLSNVEVLAERFDQFETTRKFDVVTLIGVLEYANIYGKGSRPALDMLQRACSLLKTDGRLILAIENQLGLKYFAGSQEDHVGIPLFGIEDRYTFDGVATYGRFVLKNLLSSAGFSAQDWWYPFPDYKLPKVVVSDKGLRPDFGSILSSVVEPIFETDPQLSSAPFFMMDRCWNVLVRNGVGGDFANSFLVVASPCEKVEKQSNNILAYHFAIERNPEYTKAVIFSLSGNDEIEVQQQKLYADSPVDPEVLVKMDVGQKGRFLEGVLWSYRLREIITTKGWCISDINDWARQWFDALLSVAGLGDSQETLTSHQLVDGGLVDAVPRNLIVKDNGEKIFIDQEWSYETQLELGFIVFRGIYLSLVVPGKILTPSPGTPTYVFSLFSEICMHLGIDISIEDLIRYLELENKIQGWISDGVGFSINGILEYKLQIRIEYAQVSELLDMHLSDSSRNMELATHLASIYEKVSELNQVIERQNRDIDKVSAWARSIEERPLRYAIKRNLYLGSRKVFRALPLAAGPKQKIKTQAERLLRSVRSIVSRFGDDQDRRNAARASEVVQINQVDDNRDVFIFSIIDWDFRIQRPQHIARGFVGKGKRVFFFSNHFLDSNKPGYEIEALDPYLSLYQVKLKVKGAPAIYFDPPTAEHERMLEEGMAQLIFDIGSYSSISIVQHPYWFKLAKKLPNAYRLYDCMDHHEGFGNVSKNLIDSEEAMLREFDIVIVTSSWLEDFARKYNPNISLIRNAGEYDFFSKQPDKIYSDAQGRKIIGYYGAIAEWFDLDLVRSVAERNSDCLVLLVGGDTINAEGALSDLNNVIFTGEVPYSDLPYYLYAFDVCLFPFKVIPLTLATNPVKVYEYLASGKPVVCVNLPEISQFGNLVYRAESAEEFVNYVSMAIEKEVSSDIFEARRAFAANQTWHHRVTQLTEDIDRISLPKISVIVLTYNNIELTKACLNSLVTKTDYPNLEVVIVDNASSDESPQYLEMFEKQHENVKLILNETNMGFATGNNIGLAAATGDYLVLLNNDTVVTQGWALTMLRHLQDDPTIGLIGPITNNIGNEARFPMTYQDDEDMLTEAHEVTLRHMGRTYAMRTVAFFCAMMPRAVYEACGPISEDYGRGFFEDDDYCRRVEAIGKRVVCADDVFVHHHLSASFNKLKDEERQQLFENNKKIYESKWGVWEPHAYREWR